MDKLGQIKIIDTDIDLIKSEILRFEAFNIQIGDYDFTKSFYYLSIKDKTIIPYGLYIRGQLVAGCYVSNTFGSLYIDQLFVKPALQNSGLRLGRILLRYVLANKKHLEEIFNKDITTSMLEPLNEKCTAIYEKEGYEKKDMVMVKRI